MDFRLFSNIQRLEDMRNILRRQHHHRSITTTTTTTITATATTLGQHQ